MALTRPAGQNDELATLLAGDGHEVVEVPLIAVEYMRTDDLVSAVARLADFEWLVFTSANGVHAFFEVMAEAELPPIAVVGASTGAAVESYGTIPALTASAATAEVLAAEFPAGAGRVLFPTSDIGGIVLPNGLVEKGWSVTTVIAYRTLSTELASEQSASLAACDLAVLSSASAVRSFERTNISLPVVTIGPSTTAEAVKSGMEVAAEASEPTADAMAAAVRLAALRSSGR